MVVSSRVEGSHRATRHRKNDDGPEPVSALCPVSSAGSGAIEIEFAASARMRITIPSGVGGWIPTGHIDIRRAMNSLAVLVQEAFGRDPHGRDLVVFHGKSGKLIKIV